MHKHHIGIHFSFLKVFLFISIVVPFIASPFRVEATFSNGENALAGLGQYDGTSVIDPVPSYTRGNTNDTPNRSGVSIPRGMVLDSVNHRLFVLETANSRVMVYNLTAGDVLIDRVVDNVLGQANFVSNTLATTSSGMRLPQGLAFDSVNNKLFVGDSSNNRVLVYDTATITDGEAAVNVLGQANFTTSTSGTTSTTMSSPTALLYDSANTRLYVADASNNRVLVFNTATITDGEAAVNVLGQALFTTSANATTAAGMAGGSPTGLAYVSATNRLFVTNGNRVSIFDVAAITDGEAAVNVLGQALFTTNTAATTQSGLNAPAGLAYNSATSRLFVADKGNNRIMVFDIAAITDGENAVNVLGQADFISSSSATSQSSVNGPEQMVMDAVNSRLYVSQSGAHRVTVFDVATVTDNENAVDGLGQYDGTSLSAPVPHYTKLGTNEQRNRLGFSSPNDVLLDGTNHRLFVADKTNNRVLVYNMTAGNILSDHIPDNVLGQADFNTVTANVTQAGMSGPTGLAFDSGNNRLYVAQSGVNRVTVYDTATITDGENAINVLGQALFTTSASGLTSSTMFSPNGMAYASSKLYVADSDNNRVLVFDVSSITDGEAAVNVLGQSNFTSNATLATQSSLWTPKDVAYDSNYNRLFVADAAVHRVLVFDVSSISDGENAVNVLGQSTYTASTSATTAARMNNPTGVEYDTFFDRLFVSDTTNNRVLLFDVSSITNGQNATGVLGQTLFTTSSSAVSQSGMASPFGLTYDVTNKYLYTTLTTQHRINGYDVMPTTIAGQVYTDEGITTIADGKTVSLLVNGVLSKTTTTYNGDGSYIFSAQGLNSGDILTVFIDGETENGVSITIYDGTALTDFDIYQNYIITRTEDGSDFTASMLDTAHSGDTDITALYSDGASTEIYNGATLYVWPSMTFNQDSDNILYTGDIKVPATATFDLDAGTTLTSYGSVLFIGSFVDDSGDMIYLYGDGDAETYNPGSASINSIVTLDSAADITLSTNSLYTLAELYVNSGSTLDLSSFGLQVDASFSLDGEIELVGGNTVTLTTGNDLDSGTWTYYGNGVGAASTLDVVDFGVDDYYLLEFNDTSAVNSDTFRLVSDLHVIGTLTLTDGAFTGQAQAMNLDGGLSILADGSFTSTSGTMTLGSSTTLSNLGTFTHNSGSVVLSGDNTIKPTAATTFYNISMSDSVDDSNSPSLILRGNISVAGSMTLDGFDADDMVNLVSSVVATARTITFTGASTFTGDYIYVIDNTVVDSSTGITLELNPSNSTDGGNTVGWFSDAPVVTNVTSSTANGSYKAPNVISIQVTFDAAVDVTGSPELLLETGTTDEVATYTSGTGTTTLTFTYTVAAGDTSADLEYFSTGALTLNGGTIQLSVYPAQAADLTLPVLAGAGSLSFNKAIVIDTTHDAAPGTPSLTAATDTGVSNTDEITYETVPDFELSCVTGSTVELFEGGVTSLGTGVCVASTVTITSIVTFVDGTYSITAIQTDVPGNVSVSSPTMTLVVDTTAPAVVSSAPDLDASSDTGVSSTDDMTSDTTPTFIGTGAIANAPIRLYDNGTLVCSTTATGIGTWTCTAGVMTAATHSNMTVRQTDTAGNESADNASPFSFLIDDTNPTGAFVTAAFLNNNAGNQTITFTTEDSHSGIQSDTYIVVTDSIMGALTPSCAVLPSTPGDVVTCTVDISTAANAEETHVISVTTTDIVGKSATFSSPNYIIDRKAPTITMFDVDPLTLTPADLTDPVITFTATDGIAVDYYEINDNGGGFNVETSPYFMTGASLISLNTVILRVTDTAGNQVTQTAMFYPLITINAPTILSNATITDTTVDILIGAPGYLDAAAATYNGGGSTAMTCVPAIATNPTTTTCTLDDNITVTSTLSVDASGDPDGAGPSGSINGAQAQQAYTIETTLPVITPTTPTLISQATITDATFTITDANGIASVTFGGTATNSFTCYDPFPTVATFPTTSVSITCTGTISTSGTVTVDAVDRAGNSATQYSGTFHVDSTDPIISAMSPVAGTYNAVQTISFSVTDADAGVTDTDVSITGGTSPSCTQAGANTVNCTVDVNANETITVTAYDNAGNDATSGPHVYVIDLVAPTVVSVDSTNASGLYASGTIDVVITFTEAVTVTGSPYITLETGATDRDATYTSGSGTTTLTFTYTIVSGDSSADLDYVATNSLVLNGGTIQDAAANNATLTLAAPGAANSLGDNKDIVIDTIADAAPGTPDLKAASDSGTSNTDDLTNINTPSFVVSCVTASTVTILEGGNILGTGVCLGGTVTIASSVLADGTYSVYAYQTDVAGNQSVNSGTLSVTIDTTAPATLAAPDLDAGSDTGTSNTDDITSDTTPTFTGVCVTGDTIKLYADGVLEGSMVCAGNAYSITTGVMSEATHTMTATATDDAGNVSAVSPDTDIEIDITAPGAPGTPNLITADDSGTSSIDDITNVTTPSFTISCVTGSIVTLKSGVTIYGTGTCVASTVTITSSVLVDATYPFVAYQTDIAGNQSVDSGSLSVEIDTTAPSALVAPDLDTASDTGTSNTDDITSDFTPTLSGVCTTGDIVKLYAGATLVGQMTCAAAVYSITSSALADAVYSMTVTFTDTAGNVSASSPALSVTIDTTPDSAPGTPDLAVASDTGTSSTDDITSDNTPTISVTCATTATVDIYDGATIIDSGTCVAGSYTTTLGVQPDGTYTITARQTDLAGNVSTSSGTLTLIIDTAEAAPGTPDMTSGTDSGTSNSDDITSDTTPDFTMSCNTDSIVYLYQDALMIISGTCAGGTITLTAPAMVDGTYSMTAIQLDLAGNLSVASGALSVTIDTTADAAPGTPDMTSGTDTGTSNSDDITNDNTPDFTLSCVTGSIVTLYDGATNIGTGTCVAGTVTITSSALTDGSHTITATQTDPAGNVSPSSGSLSVTIDTAADAAPGTPDMTSATDTGTSNSDNITSDSTPDFTLSCVTGSTVILYAGATNVGSGTCAGGTITITSSVLADATYSMTATQTDTAGNVSAASGSLSVTIDTAEPVTGTPDMTSGTDSGTSNSDDLTNDNTPTFTLSCNTGSTVTLYDGASSVGTGTCVAGSVTITASTLTDGAHTMTATQTDDAGNTSASSPSLVVTIDTTADASTGTPDMTPATDTGLLNTDNITTDTTPDFTISCVTGSTVILYADATNVGSGTCVAGTITITSSILATGTYAMTATQTDDAGNVSTASTALTAVIGGTVPGAPQTLTATAGNAKVTLNWTAPASNGGHAISDYIIEYKLSTDLVYTTFVDGVSVATTVQVTGLTNGLLYDFQVSAQNAIGTGPTAAVSATPTKPSSGGGGGGSADLCTNIAGNQTTVPAGYTRLNNMCTQIVVPTVPTTPVNPNPTNPAEVCSPLISGSITPNGINDPIEVNKLIAFLNQYEGEKLALDGKYDLEDIQAVKRFQTKYFNEIIKPWGGIAATGNVLNYTRGKINVMNCAKIKGCPYFTQYATLGTTGGDVFKIQNFLNLLMGKNLNEPAYTQTVFNAVKEYQTLYRESVLRPLGLTYATGYWHKYSTLTGNNLVGCYGTGTTQ